MAKFNLKLRMCELTQTVQRKIATIHFLVLRVSLCTSKENNPDISKRLDVKSSESVLFTGYSFRKSLKALRNQAVCKT